MNIRGWILLLALLWSGRPLAADLPDAQPSRHFLRRPPLSAYTNYGEDLYRPYRREIRLAPRYDFLGRFLAEGFLVYELLTLRSFQSLQFIEGISNGLEIESSPQRTVIESMFDPQALQATGRIQGHKTVVALRAYPLGRRLG